MYHKTIMILINWRLKTNLNYRVHRPKPTPRPPVNPGDPDEWGPRKLNHCNAIERRYYFFVLLAARSPPGQTGGGGGGGGGGDGPHFPPFPLRPGQPPRGPPKIFEAQQQGGYMGMPALPPKREVAYQ